MTMQPAMQSIATLAQSDPYLKMPRHERIAARKARQANLRRKMGRLEAALDAVSESPPAPPPIVEPVFSFGAWVARQERISPLPKAPWFSIVSETGPSEPARIKVEDIQRVVALRYRVARSDILSARRTANIVRPRQIAMYLAKTLTLRSLPEIGRRFGGRDHTTVLHAVRKITLLVDRDVDLAEEVEALKKQLRD